MNRISLLRKRKAIDPFRSADIGDHARWRGQMAPQDVERAQLFEKALTFLQPSRFDGGRAIVFDYSRQVAPKAVAGSHAPAERRIRSTLYAPCGANSKMYSPAS